MRKRELTPAIGLLVALILTGCAANEITQTKTETTVELGSEFSINSADYFELGSKVNLEDIQMAAEGLDVNAVGTYTVAAVYKDNNYEIKVNVVDTTAPTIKAKEVLTTTDLGAWLVASDYAEGVDITETKVSFATEAGDVEKIQIPKDLDSSVKEIEYTVVAVDASGNRSEEITVKADIEHHFSLRSIELVEGTNGEENETELEIYTCDTCGCEYTEYSKEEWVNLKFSSDQTSYIETALYAIAAQNIETENSYPYTRVIPGEYGDWKSIFKSIQTGKGAFEGIEKIAASRIEGSQYYFTKEDFEKLAYSLTGSHIQLTSIQEAYDYVCSVYGNHYVSLLSDNEIEYVVFEVSGKAGYLGTEMRTLESKYIGHGTWEVCGFIHEPTYESNKIPTWCGYMYATVVADSESILGGFRLENIRWDSQWHDIGSFGKSENEYKDKTGIITNVEISDVTTSIVSTERDAQYSFSCIVNGKEMTGTFIALDYTRQGYLTYMGIVPPVDTENYIVYDIDGDGVDELVIGVKKYSNGNFLDCSIHVMKVTDEGMKEVFSNYEDHYINPVDAVTSGASIVNDKLTVGLCPYDFSYICYYLMLDEHGLVIKVLDENEEQIISCERNITAGY